MVQIDIKSSKDKRNGIDGVLFQEKG